MQILLVVSLLLSAPALDINLAPDQPLPFVYTDDPLILELQSTEDAQAVVQLSVQTLAQSQPTELSLDPLSLRAKGNRWIPIQGLPVDRGYYTATIRVTVGDAVVDKTAPFCRIDRIGSMPALPVSAIAPDAFQRLALSAVGVRAAHFNASHPALETSVREASGAGYDVSVVVDCANLPAAPDTAAHLVTLLGSAVKRWEIDVQGNASLFPAVREAMHNAGCAVPIAAVVSSPETLAALINANTDVCLRDIVLLTNISGDENLKKVVAITEENGCESWRLSLRGLAPVSGESVAGPMLVHTILNNLRAGASETDFHASSVYDGNVRPAMIYLNGLAQRFPAGAEFVGALETSPTETALVFRKGAAWLAAAWTTNAEARVNLPIGDAQHLLLTDAFNNPRPLPAPENGVIHLTLSQDPLYLSGTRGPLPGAAARNHAVALAQQYSQDSRFQTLPPDLLSATAAIAADPTGSNARPNFLALVRYLPLFEQQLQTASAPRQITVPAMAALAKLIRVLCIVEQSRGENFLDPIQDTLARCEELQSQYLTGSTGTANAHERGDWLLAEVRRLMDAAEDLLALDARIEAAAVAMLAEWRARGLEFATAAQLAPAPIPAPAPEPPQKPPVSEEIPTATPKEITHSVERGETPASIAKKYGISVDEFLKQNNIKKGAILRIGKKYRVILPTASPESLEPAASTAFPPEAPNPTPEDTAERTHIVAKGEFPSSIAAQYGVSVNDLLLWNRLSPKSTLRIGQKLIVRTAQPQRATREPAEETPEDQAPPEVAPSQPAPAAQPEEVVHTVQRGETPASIAEKYGISLDAFLKLNGIKKGAALKAGKQYRVIPPHSPQSAPETTSSGVKQPPPEHSSGEITHWVAKGEYPSSIAAKYGVSVADLLRWNRLTDKSRLHIGQKLMVYAPGTTNSTAGDPSAGQEIIHTVTKGENPSAIARKYGVALEDFLKWNNLSKNAKFQIGDKFKVILPAASGQQP